MVENIGLLLSTVGAEIVRLPFRFSPGPLLPPPQPAVTKRTNNPISLKNREYFISSPFAA
jgi:hypothetical protein